MTARRWTETVPCDRPHPDDPEDACPGTVTIRGYDDPGRNYGASNDDAYPPESDVECDPCDHCGYDDWTADELYALADRDGDWSASDAEDEREARYEQEWDEREGH